MLSRAVVNAYVSAYDVDMTEAVPPNGTGAYPTFDSFFTRKLRDGARPISSADGIVSPADGRLESAGPVHAGGLIQVKGSEYRVADLVGDEEAAKRYDRGQFAVIYLSPRDYHRVHAPAAGRLTQVRSCPGELFPVNAISERHIPQYLSRNRRVAMVIDTDALGEVTLVMVAAMIVGRITVSGVNERDVPLGTHTVSPAHSFERGDELGIFHLGSTVVIFTEAGVPLIGRDTSPVPLGSAVAMGDLLTANPAAATAAGDLDD